MWSSSILKLMRKVKGEITNSNGALIYCIFDNFGGCSIAQKRFWEMSKRWQK